MTHTLFPPEIYRARRASACQVLHAAGLQSFLALHPTTLHWLTGAEAKSYQAFQCALLDGRDGSVTLFAREGEHAEIADTACVDTLAGWSALRGEDPLAALSSLLARRDLDGPCGVEIVPWYVTPAQHHRLSALLAHRFVEAPDLLDALRLVRGPEELDCLRRAGRIADAAIAAFAEALRPGLRECDLAAAIYAAILGAGGEAPPVPLNLSGGRRAGYPHGAPTDRRLAAPESGNAEFAVPWKRYTVSIGRTYALGAPPARLVAMYEAVRRAQAAMLGVLRAGVATGEVFEAGMGAFRAAGLAHLVAHTIGYSVAPAFPPATGERLGLAAGAGRKLASGMTLSLAPNLFDRDARLGARLVDNVIIGERGAERLTHADDALIVVP